MAELYGIDLLSGSYDTRPDRIDGCAPENLRGHGWALIVTRPHRQIIVRRDARTREFFFCFEDKRINFGSYDDAAAVANRLADLPTRWREPREITEPGTPYGTGEAA